MNYFEEKHNKYEAFNRPIRTNKRRAFDLSQSEASILSLLERLAN